MRHRVYGKHLGRNRNQRKALFKGLVRSLILHESITTTEAKAKAVKGLIDKLVVKGKGGSASAKQFVQGFLPDAAVSQKLLEEVAPRFLKRTSGFTSLVKLGRRLGDGAMMVKVSWVEGEKEKVKNQNSKINPSTTLRVDGEQGRTIKTTNQNSKVVKETKTKKAVTKKSAKEKK